MHTHWTSCSSCNEGGATCWLSKYSLWISCSSPVTVQQQQPCVWPMTSGSGYCTCSLMLRFLGQRRPFCSSANESMPLCDANVGFSDCAGLGVFNSFLSTELTVAMFNVGFHMTFRSCYSPCTAPLSLWLMCIVKFVITRRRRLRSIKNSTSTFASYFLCYFLIATTVNINCIL